MRLGGYTPENIEPYYDGTVGIDGDYPEIDGIYQALQDGKSSLKVISNLTETEDFGIFTNLIRLEGESNYNINLPTPHTGVYNIETKDIDLSIFGTSQIFTETTKITMKRGRLIGNNEANNFNHSTNITNAGIFGIDLDIDTGSGNFKCLINIADLVTLNGGGSLADNAIEVITKLSNVSVTGDFSTFTGGSSKYAIYGRPGSVITDIKNAATNFRVSATTNCKLDNIQGQSIEVRGDLTGITIDKCVLSSIIYINQVVTTNNISYIKDSIMDYISNAGATGGSEGISRVNHVSNTSFIWFRTLHLSTTNTTYVNTKFGTGTDSLIIETNDNVLDVNCEFNNTVNVKGDDNRIETSKFVSMEIEPTADKTIVKNNYTSLITDNGTNSELGSNI